MLIKSKRPRFETISLAGGVYLNSRRLAAVSQCRPLPAGRAVTAAAATEVSTASATAATAAAESTTTATTAATTAAATILARFGLVPAD